MFPTRLLQGLPLVTLILPGSQEELPPLPERKSQAQAQSIFGLGESGTVKNQKFFFFPHMEKESARNRPSPFQDSPSPGKLASNSPTNLPRI